MQRSALVPNEKHAHGVPRITKTSQDVHLDTLHVNDQHIGNDCVLAQQVSETGCADVDVDDPGKAETCPSFVLCGQVCADMHEGASRRLDAGVAKAKT